MPENGKPKTIEEQVKEQRLFGEELQKEIKDLQKKEEPIKEEIKPFQDVSIDAQGRKVKHVATPTNDKDASNKKYVDDKAVYGTLIFNPDGNPEGVSVDGAVGNVDAGGTAWATLHDAGTGTFVSHDQITATMLMIKAGNTEDEWEYIYRGILLFDTSMLPDDCTIVSATLSLYVTSKVLTFVGGEVPFSLDVVSCNPASNIIIATGDFDVGDFGTGTLFADEMAYGDITALAYNDIILNSDGLAAITKTGITKLGLMFKYDRGNWAPTWEIGKSAYIIFGTAESVSQKPKLKITFKYA